MQPNLIHQRLLDSWKEFYARYFNLQVEMNSDIIPDYLPGHNRLIVVAPTMNPDKVIRAMRIKFTKVRTEISDVTRIITSNEREAPKFSSDRENPTLPYAIWVKDEDNPTWEYQNDSKVLSIETLLEYLLLPTETLLEYLLHFFKTWDESGRMLNVETTMLCAGTKMVGGLPLVRYYPESEELKITTLKDGDDISNCYPRSVISKKQ